MSSLHFLYSYNINCYNGALLIIEAFQFERAVCFYCALLRAFATAAIIPLLLYVAPETASTEVDCLLIIDCVTDENAVS